jgi:hypothetical protein
MLGTKPGAAGAAGHGPRVVGGVGAMAAGAAGRRVARRAPPGGLRAWGSAVSRDLAAVRQALNEPPQRLVQAALDHWIAADVRRT